MVISGAARAAAMTTLIMTAAFTLVACGQDSDGAPAPATTGSPATPTEPTIHPPDGFPEAFPPPPEDVPLRDAELGEWALRSMDFSEQLGTAVNRLVRFEFGSGSDDDIAQVLDHYRAALPDAGWTIDWDSDEDSDPDRWQEGPVHRLRASGHGFDEVTVTAQPLDDMVLVTVSITELLVDRSPYGEHPPLIPVPDAVRALPDLPEEALREKILITDRFEEPTTVRVEFYFGEPVHEEGADQLAALAEHYRAALPASGWTVTDEQSESNTEEIRAGTTYTERLAIDFNADGVHGELRATHTRYSFDHTPIAVNVGITLTLDD